MMERAVISLLFVLLPLLAQAQSGFSLPGIGDLEQQIANSEGSKEGINNPEKEQLKQTLNLREEIDHNRQAIEEQKKAAAQAPSTRARLNAQLAELRKEKDTNWQPRYQEQALDPLVQTLVERLNALEKNQAQLTEVNNDLTRAQTLPEQAQNVISKALERIDELRSLLAIGEDENGEPLTDTQKQLFNTEQQAMESRIDRYNQELASLEPTQEIARLRQQALKLEQGIIENQLEVLQKQVNLKRTNQLEELANAENSPLPESVLKHPQVRKAIAVNENLREQLAKTSRNVNDLLRTAIDTKTQLDKVRTLSSTVNEQIRMLDGSLLLSRVLYDQQKSLPQGITELDLNKQITEARLAQFELQKAMQEQDNGPADSSESSTSEGPELQQALDILKNEREALYEQLDKELSRQLTILTRTELNNEQLTKISRSLSNTISEQTFWMPSTQPMGFRWLLKLPGRLHEQASNIPWAELLENGITLFERKWPWLILAALPALILLLLRPKLKRLIDTMNKDVGFLRRDSQAHTPLCLLYTLLISAPAPLLFAIMGVALWLEPGTFSSVIGSALTHIALLWLVFETAYRLLKENGIAQRHFRWNKEQNLQMRKRLTLTGLAFLPMTFVIAFGDQWPALLSNDRIGLVIMIVSLVVVAFSMPRVAQSYPGRHYSNAVKGLITVLAVLLPLVLIVLIGIGYYYTSVRLTGHVIYSLYLVVLWVLLDATAVRGLAVAAQRLSYRRMVAQRETEQKDTSSSEAVEVEEPQLDLKQVNQQSLRLIRLALIAGVGLLMYWVWTEILYAFSYTDNIVLWQSSDAGSTSSDAMPISLGDVIASLVIGAVTFLLASNLPGLLEVLVLSRLSLRQGTSYATTTLLSYIIVASGTVIALGALGVSWDKLQWLVAALGVGLGFGLQEIFANFISGIIILFERPIRIGDVITIGDLEGTVSRIRIRATTIIDFDRKEIIVPNKAFVTERLVNWSLSDTVTRIILRIGFAYGSDLPKCREVLLQAARENKRVLRDPEPVALFLTFGASTLDHELRVHVGDIADRLAATDEINRRVDALCKEHDIEIAFSQLDIHIRNGDGDKLCIEGEPQNSSPEQPARTGEDERKPQ